jgi:hypothetical protein
VAYYLTEKALWRLAQFASACGFSKEECRAYNTDNPNSHTMLHNKQLIVFVAKTAPNAEGKSYNEVAEVRKVDFSAPLRPAAAAQTSQPARTPPPSEDNEDPPEGLPF